ncbi:MAG: universal stress protein, partial [Chthoniobacteraceae bacterium]|nr:universal stress protein [Chthoniobacteraceae bacterium]
MNINENLGTNPEGNLDANFETILVAVDFSEVSKQVYEVAANLAQRLRAKVVVLNVSEPQLDYVGLLPA